jgi:hypothetical protein
MDLLCTTVNLFAFAPMGYQPIGAFSLHSKQTISKYHQILINIRKTRRKTTARFCCVLAAFPIIPLQKRSADVGDPDKLHILSPFIAVF